MLFARAYRGKDRVIVNTSRAFRLTGGKIGGERVKGAPKSGEKVEEDEKGHEWGDYVLVPLMDSSFNGWLFLSNEMNRDRVRNLLSESLIFLQQLYIQGVSNLNVKALENCPVFAPF